MLVIGLVDNLLRPFLVGKGSKLPDYVVLISTLGGIEVFGLNGFVIGPLIAAMFMVSWEIFAASRRASGMTPPVTRPRRMGGAEAIPSMRSAAAMCFAGPNPSSAITVAS